MTDSVTYSGDKYYFAQIQNSYNPMVVPAWFIISYSSFILALKRIRGLKLCKFIGILSGIFNYLFFASIASFLLFLEIISDNQFESRVFNELQMQILVKIIAALLIIGSANLIYLCSYRYAEELPDGYGEYNERKLNAFEYALKTGNLLAISAIIFFCQRLLKYS